MYDASPSFTSLTEHLTAVTEPKIVLPRRAAVIGLGALAVAGSLVLAAIFPRLLPLFLLLAAGLGALAWYLWRFADVEYEYLIAQGEISFSAVYGKKQRRDLYGFPLKEAEKIVSFGEDRASCDAFQADETRFYAARFDDPETLCALVVREDGRRVKIFFQGTPRAIAALRSANPRAAAGLKAKTAD